MKALVTGARLPAALEIASGLSALGIEVFAADSLFFSPTGSSRSVIQYLRFPSPRFYFNKFRKTVLEWVDKYSIDLIIPVSEEIFYLAMLHEDLNPSCTLFAPSLPFLRACHSKWDILELANNCNIISPKTVLITSKEALCRVTKHFSKYIIKPEFSRGAYGLLFHADQFKEQTKISEQHRWLVQEYITGQELCSYSIASKGNLLAHTVYEPLYRVGSGASLYFKPIENSLLNDYVEHFVKSYAYTGQLSFDFLITKEGRLVVLECNPRATSGVHLVAQSKAWCRAFLGEKIDKIKMEDMEARAAKFSIILLNSIHALKKKQLLGFIADLRKAKDTLFNIKDLAPVLTQQLCIIEIICRCIKWKISPEIAYTFDLEWNGEPKPCE
ncbi:TPA: ATP-grasp domain-containing protein [Legionella pneumophila]|nr:ATP-grasp domain-containing protein [Legionella pneumophila]HAT7769217.1 ATP-grasp domain-containing protein [Legionella pneumophila]HAU1684022.1 ATP-grasp domain-containing protein [Legionella pneumophila]HAU1717494.1 ATP-grasp domain-containing protein [Legionella pneumophila]